MHGEGALQLEIHLPSPNGQVQVIERYNKKFRPTMYAKMQAAATASAAAAAAAAVAAAAAAAGPSS